MLGLLNSSIKTVAAVRTNGTGESAGFMCECAFYRQGYEIHRLFQRYVPPSFSFTALVTRL
jgi:hypothetical protein